MTRQDIYSGNSQDISFSVLTGYDDYGNTVYARGPEGGEHFYSYANTNSQNRFSDSKGVSITLFTNQFYPNSIPSYCHALPVGEAFINNGKVTETYYRYDAKGNVTETKTLFPTRNYKVFSGVFTEIETFEIDLSELTISDGILVISSRAVPTPETLYEIHSEPGRGWLNTGTWNGSYFLADYTKCVSVPEPDCFEGQVKIGPFEHYPGTPNYTGYTKWIEDNNQYIQANYSAIVNEYPEKVEYNLNNTSWTTVTTNLGSGTTSTVIPSSSFAPDINTLQFRESNTLFTKFEWTLYVNQGSTPEEYTTTFTYDLYGNVTSSTDPEGNVMHFGYDSHSIYLTSIINALNQTITATYDFSTGWMTSMTDAERNTTSFEYDILGRVTKKINSDQTEKDSMKGI